VSGGIVNGSGNVTVDGMLDWSSGSMAGTGTTTVNGALNLATTGQKGVQRTINSSGTATWTAGDIRLYATGGGFNHAGPFDAQSDGTVNTIFDTGTFHNTGTFKRTVSNTISSMTSAFDNDGTVDVQTGGLSLAGGGGVTTNTGSFDATGALLRFTNGTFNL